MMVGIIYTLMAITGGTIKKMCSILKENSNRNYINACNNYWMYNKQKKTFTTHCNDRNYITCENYWRYHKQKDVFSNPDKNTNCIDSYENYWWHHKKKSMFTNPVNDRIYIDSR